MQIQYDEQEDILNIEFTNALIVKDVSYGWNINVGFTSQGIAEITILDAKANGYWSLEHVKDPS